MTKRNLLRAALVAAVTIWFGIFAFLTLRPDSQMTLPTQAALPTSVAVAASPTETQPPTLTAIPVRSLPTTVAATIPPTSLPTEEPIPTVATDATDTPPDGANAVVENQLILQFAPDASQEERAAYIEAIGGTVQSEIRALNTVVVQVPDASSAQLASAAVISTEPDYYAYALYDFDIPSSDPFIGQQWSLDPIGVMDVWNDVPETAVTVAVLDSGICATHPDLSGRILAGWDYVADDSNPNDENGHGCGVSSVIAANIDNGLGMAGIAPNATILPLRVLNASGSGSYSDVAQAIIDATDQGADIINLSLGGPASSTVLHNAVLYAVSRDVTVIAAAGNDGLNGALYPAAYSEVISVGALDQNLNIASFSNYGSQIDVWAPGANIFTAYLGNSYAMQNGTSFAAPIVSGIAAMEIALGRELDLSGTVIHIPPVEDVVQVPTETHTPEPEPTSEIRPGMPNDLLRDVEPPTPSDLWAVRLVAGTDPATLATSLGFQYVGTVGSLPNTYLFRLAGSDQQTTLANSAASRLASSSSVELAQQQFFYTPTLHTVPSEPGLSTQWHLNNTGQSGGTAGVDVNAYDAWNVDLGGGNYVDGSGVVIAIVDDGLQYTHPGIAPNYLASASYDFQGDDPNPQVYNPDPYPMPDSTDGHGTSVGGIAAGSVDGSCGVGASYAAQVSGLRLLRGSRGISDIMVANSQNYASSSNDIYNNSWGIEAMIGPNDFWVTQDGLEYGITNGRNGLGSIYTWASGNYFRAYDGSTYVYLGYNVNNDWPANSRYTIAVGAVNHNGTRSYYSVPGAALVVTAPSSGKFNGTYTTDLMGANGYTSGNCVDGFGGTSSASPLVAGVIGLMLEANPNLGWRDVQHILAETSVMVDPTDQDEASNWTTNGAGYTHSDAYGFGMIDAGAAVNTALTWENVPPEMVLASAQSNVNQTIPDGSGIYQWLGEPSTVVYGAAVTDAINIPDNIIVEHVEIVFDVDIAVRGDLFVTLTSPEGTQSILTNPHHYQNGSDLANYDNWPFMTVRNWGESSQGNWTISVQDGYEYVTGTFNSWSLRIYGTLLPPTSFTAVSGSGANEVDVTWVNSLSPHTGVTVQSSEDGDTWFDAATVAAPATSVTLDTLECGVDYYFRVRADNTTASTTSRYTAPVMATANNCAQGDPLNDPLPIAVVPTTIEVDTTLFGINGDPLPSCGYDATRTAWFSFTPSVSGTYRISTTGSDIDTVLSIWKDDGGMTEIGCDDDSGSGNSALLRQDLSAGTTYYLTVAGNGNTGGDVDLNIDQLAAPTDTPEPTLTPEPTDVPAPVQSTIGLMNPELAFWSFRDSNESGWADIQFRFGYAEPGWFPVVGDWNGDGIDGIGLYKDGIWLLRDTSNGGSVEQIIRFGTSEPGWQPIAGDWDGDQQDGLGLYKDGAWRLRNDLQSGNRDVNITFNPFEGNGTAIVGDWNNDGFDSPGLFNNGTWALRQTNQRQSSVSYFRFGEASSRWQPVIGDWDSDGYDTPGLFYNGTWYLMNDTNDPRIDASFQFGSSGIPVANYRGGMSGLTALSQPPTPAEPVATATFTLTPTTQPSATPTLTASPTATLTLTPTPLPSATATATTPPSATPLPVEPSPEATAEVTQEPQDSPE